MFLLNSLFNEMYLVGEHWDHESSCSEDEDVGDIETIRAPKAIRVSVSLHYNLLNDKV